MGTYAEGEALTQADDDSRRPHIDVSRCQGHGRCYTLEPELFDYDDDDHGLPRDVDMTPELLGRAQKVVAECPERAISLVAHSRDQDQRVESHGT
jgi:ferredoxin